MSEHYFDNYEWLKKRIGRFTASEIHKLFVASRTKGKHFGDTAMTYIRQKAAELLTLQVKEEINFKQAEWGKANEFEAVQAFEKLTGLKGQYYGVANPTFFNYGDYAGGSPDWEIEGEEGADVKCPFNTDEHVKNLMLKSADDFSDVRWEYYCQAQMNMYIRKWKRFHFVSYDPRMIEHKYRLKILTVYPDAVWVNQFNEKLTYAITELQTMIAALELPSVIIASRDNGVGATIVEGIKK